MPLPPPDFFFPPEDAAFVSLAPSCQCSAGASGASGGAGSESELARQLTAWDARDPEVPRAQGVGAYPLHTTPRCMLIGTVGLHACVRVRSCEV